jgi:aspartyl-tRNA(Asn)/glutamyl-tRNA(Gln) amidotransferase subunit A
MPDMTFKTLLEARDALRRGETSSLALTEHALEAAYAHADLSAFAVLDEARALEQARARDLESPRGALHGVPVTVKDLFNVAGLPTRAGTAAELPEGFQGEARADALAVKRLIDAGAVILGKTNLHEIALGITGENPHTGDVKNPLDIMRQAGGSSSGSAAATAAGAGFASLGTDTGGSVRIPASFCGLVGFKPTFGLIPLEGALNLSPTCDHAGPLARTVADAHALLEVLAHRNLPLRALPDLRALRLGVPRAWLEGRLGTAVRGAFEALLEVLKGAGATVNDVAPDALERAGESYTPLVRAEAAFVHRASLAAHPETFGDAVRPALLAGAALPISAYLEARALRRRVRAGLETTLRDVHALVLPCAPLPAPLRGTTTVTLESGERAHRDAFIELTLPFSLVGLPTLSLPFTHVDGLPVGLQIVTAKGEDALALEIGAWLEANVEDASRAPG